MLTGLNSTSYILALKQTLKRGPDAPRLLASPQIVDLVLMTMYLGLSVKIYYLTDDGLLSKEIAFLPTSPQARLYLTSDGYFDVLYNKAYIKSAGVCQALVLDVSCDVELS